MSICYRFVILVEKINPNDKMGLECILSEDDDVIYFGLGNPLKKYFCY